MMAGWNEQDHPREQASGRFSTKTNGNSADDLDDTPPLAATPNPVHDQAGLQRLVAQRVRTLPLPDSMSASAKSRWRRKVRDSITTISAHATVAQPGERDDTSLLIREYAVQHGFTDDRLMPMTPDTEQAVGQVLDGVRLHIPDHQYEERRALAERFDPQQTDELRYAKRKKLHDVIRHRPGGSSDVISMSTRLMRDNMVTTPDQGLPDDTELACLEGKYDPDTPIPLGLTRGDRIGCDSMPGWIRQQGIILTIPPQERAERIQRIEQGITQALQRDTWPIRREDVEHDWQRFRNLA